MKGTRVLIILSALLISFHAVSRAELKNKDLPNRGGFKIKPLIIHTAFKTELQLDSNVFLESEKEKFDIITILNPSFGAEVPVFGDSNLSMDYDMRANLFGRFKEHSFVDHRIRGLAEINLTDYKITIGDVYRWFSERAGSEDAGRIKRQSNFLDTNVTAEFDQFGFETGYSFGIEDFLDDDIIYSSSKGTLTYQDKDRYLNVFDAAASYRIMPKTWVLVEEVFGLISYDSSKSSDSWFTEMLLGVRGNLTNKITSTLKAGLRYQNYDDSDITDSDDFLGPVVRGDVTYNMTKDDIFILRLERAVYESTFENMNYYDANQIGLNYTHYFNDKISLNLFGSYQLNLYPGDATVGGVTDKRYDNLFGGGALLRYDVQKWLAFKTGYEYRQRKSRFGTYDYIDNLVTLSATVGF